MPSRLPHRPLKANHRYINLYCDDCHTTYSRKASEGRKCPVKTTHRVTKSWGSIKQNTKFQNPDLATFRRPKRITKRTQRREFVSHVRLDRFLLRQGFDDLDKDEVDTEDYDYALPANFNPSMRYTKGASRTCRSYDKNLISSQKTTGIVQIANAVGRPCSPGSVMGTKFGAKAKSAQRWSNRGTPYKLNRYKSLEWCHLQADSLGGPTQVDNLVAASFAANTEMLVIEHFLKGKTQFAVEVTAFCSAPHVAEFIYYEVHKASLNNTFTRKFTRLIDARNDYLTKADAEDLRSKLSTALKK